MLFLSVVFGVRDCKVNMIQYNIFEIMQDVTIAEVPDVSCLSCLPNKQQLRSTCHPQLLSLVCIIYECMVRRRVKAGGTVLRVSVSTEGKQNT